MKKLILLFVASILVATAIVWVTLNQRSTTRQAGPSEAKPNLQELARPEAGSSATEAPVAPEPKRAVPVPETVVVEAPVAPVPVQPEVTTPAAEAPPVAAAPK